MNTHAAPNFASIMDEAPTAVDRPKPLPEGTYLAVVKDYERDKAKKTGTPYTKFIFNVISPLEDVDTEALEAAGGIGTDRTIRSDSFWETPDAIWRLDQFHEHCGLDLNEAMARKFRNDEVINRSVLIFIQHSIDENDPSRVYANVTKTAPAE